MIFYTMKITLYSFCRWWEKKERKNGKARTKALFLHHLLAVVHLQIQDRRRFRLDIVPLNCQAFDHPWWYLAAEALQSQQPQHLAGPADWGNFRNFENS